MSDTREINKNKDLVNKSLNIVNNKEKNELTTNKSIDNINKFLNNNKYINVASKGMKKTEMQELFFSLS